VTLLAKTASEDRGADINMKLLPGSLTRLGDTLRAKLPRVMTAIRYFLSHSHSRRSRGKFIGCDDVIKFPSQNLNEHLLFSISNAYFLQERILFIVNYAHICKRCLLITVICSKQNNFH